MHEYESFLESKAVVAVAAGIDNPPALPDHLFEYQRVIVSWALKRGKACIFSDCGTGKTLMELEWARCVNEHTGKPVLILAPLAVAHQTVREGERFGIAVTPCRTQSDCSGGVNITNYEMLHHFDPSVFSGIVADESGIIKNFEGKIRNALIEAFALTPFKLACTATPAPNDFMELGNHSEFMGAMTRVEMLSMFFVHDGGDTSQWRLKRHAEDAFWKWVASWAICMRKPSDLGFSDDGFELPALNIIEHVIEAPAPEGKLFAMDALTLNDQRDARKASLEDRVKLAAELVNSKPRLCQKCITMREHKLGVCIECGNKIVGYSDDPSWLIWCDLNAEGDALEKAIPDAVQVAGADTDDHKESAMSGFTAGTNRVLVTKQKIAGWGMNWQHCNNMVFVGVSHSFEAFYQAIRRCWRFGQKNPVNVHLIISSAERAVLRNLQRKEKDAQRLAQGMVKHMKGYTQEQIKMMERDQSNYKTGLTSGKGWQAYLGDCVEQSKILADNSIHYSIFSPPFASLYTYSNSDRDMGNCKTNEEFVEHFKFLVKELYRVMMPGRLLSFHCMNLPTSKARDGEIGIWDFRGDLIKAFIKEGFIYHSEVVIWKDPVTAMQRTKALGLLHKQLKKDSCMSRQGIPDYLVTMRKPGENPERVTHTNETFPVNVWQRYASPVWMDINPSDTLQRESAREEADERHICPLQLQVIERALDLWTNPDDLVLSPFMGIGSEGYVSIKKGRRFVGIELKESYWNQAVSNLQAIEDANKQLSIQLLAPSPSAV